MSEEWTSSIIRPHERPQNSNQASEFIDAIRSARGNISAADEIELTKNTPEFARNHRQLATDARRAIAKHTILVSEQLYSSRFRFIYELIQNADDSFYTSATKTPFLRFRMRPKQLIVETNEDGFTARDVASICATGESSKSADSTTTGEKGFGFKSVFGIANKVHIRSGLWSFYFEHVTGDSGIGMVTPIWEDRSQEELSTDITTSITLDYAEADSNFIRSLRSELEKLSSDVLFALRKLSEIQILFEHVKSSKGDIVFGRKSGLRARKMVLSSKIGDEYSERVYRVFRKSVTNLPLTKKRAMSTSEVILGFEYEKDTSDPYSPEYGQNVFAFLPVRQVRDLPFIIQADFILAADREKIPDLPWNRALRTGVADTFVDAILLFCQDGHQFAHSWMRFLPHAVRDEFWRPLFDDINTQLQSLPVLETRTQRTLARPSDIRTLPATFLFENEPLLPDLDGRDIYVSDAYDECDFHLLRKIGVKKISSAQIMSRIEADDRRIHCRWKQKDLKDDWHTSFTSCLEHLSQSESIRARLYDCNIIPLSDKTWKKIKSAGRWSRIYLPFFASEGPIELQIPGDVGISTLHPIACRVSERESVYKRFGIEDCPNNEVVKAILKFHEQLIFSSLGKRAPELSLTNFILHFEILFWDGYTNPVIPKQLLALNKSNRVMVAKHLFFSSQREFETETLLDATSVGIEQKDRWLMNPAYMKSETRNVIRNGLTWTQWLADCVGVRCYPTLISELAVPYTVNQSKSEFHSILRLVVSNAPHKFVGNLHAHWTQSYAAECQSYGHLRNMIRETRVRCGNTELVELSGTILPTMKIREECKRFELEDELPLLELPIEICPADEHQWKFLTEFGVICSVDLRFYLHVLSALQSIDDVPEWLLQSCKSIYLHISECSKLSDTIMLQRVFHEDLLVFVSNSGIDWVSPECCVWDGPDSLMSKHVLKTMYAGHDGAEKLCKTLLEIEDATLEDILSGLTLLSHETKDHSLPSCQKHALELYTFLVRFDTEPLKTALRTAFARENLIYARGDWHRISSCIWNCGIKITGCISLEEEYPKLRDFFVETLGLRVMTPEVLLDEWVRLSSQEVPVYAEIKQVILAAGQSLRSKEDMKLLEHRSQTLRKIVLLPVLDDDQKLLKRAEERYYTIDNYRYGDMFHGKLPFVDFSPSELLLLSPMFQLPWLKNHGLSSYIEYSTEASMFTEHHDLTQHLRQRAYALSCCAISYKSKRYLDLDDRTHKLLMGSRIHTSSSLKTILIFQDAETKVEVVSDRALVKISETAQQIDIFVPDDAESLHSSYRTELPHELAKLLGIDGNHADKQIYRILNEEVQGLDEIMEDEDIMSVDWLDKLTTPSQHLMLPEDLDIISTQVSTPDTRETSGQETVKSLHSQRDQDETRSIPNVGSPRPMPQSAQNPIQRAVQNNQYRRLLEHVVRQGRNVPSGLLNMRDLQEGLFGSESSLNGFSLCEALGLDPAQARGFEENAKVGVAGELFVFERIRALGIPDFELDQWQSKIRHYVRILPEYNTIEPWNRRETTDLVYTDTDGSMAQLLERYSHRSSPDFNQLDRPSQPEYLNETPHPTDDHVQKQHGIEAIEYMIEVKTTTGACETPFYVSNGQYHLMRSHTFKPVQRPRSVYVIFRVYNLLSDNIGLEVYVDPWRLKDTVLKFETQKWLVTPI